MLFCKYYNCAFIYVKIITLENALEANIKY